MLRTADANSPVPGATIAGTLALFVVAYGIVFWFGIYYINRLINRGLLPVVPQAPEALPNRPLSAARQVPGQTKE
jgi:cytochrome d ubiquinol oxidase subunit I